MMQFLLIKKLVIHNEMEIFLIKILFMKIFNSIDNNHFHKMQKAKDKEKKVQI